MSLYWQQAVQNGDNSQQSQEGQHSSQQTGSQWDHINLNGVPSSSYQWGNYSQNTAANSSWNQVPAITPQPQQNQPAQHANADYGYSQYSNQENGHGQQQPHAMWNAGAQETHVSHTPILPPAQNNTREPTYGTVNLNVPCADQYNTQQQQQQGQTCATMTDYQQQQQQQGQQSGHYSDQQTAYYYQQPNYTYEVQPAQQADHYQVQSNQQVDLNHQLQDSQQGHQQYQVQHDQQVHIGYQSQRGQEVGPDQHLYNDEAVHLQQVHEYQPIQDHHVQPDERVQYGQEVQRDQQIQADYQTYEYQHQPSQQLPDIQQVTDEFTAATYSANTQHDASFVCPDQSLEVAPISCGREVQNTVFVGETFVPDSTHLTENAAVESTHDASLVAISPKNVPDDSPGDVTLCADVLPVVTSLQSTPVSESFSVATNNSNLPVVQDETVSEVFLDQQPEEPEDQEAWDDWVKTDAKGVEEETTPSDTVSHTQSEPPHFDRSDSEPTVSESAPYVAQVAPLVKAPSIEPSTENQQVARVEPVTMNLSPAVSEPSNVQRVAPTRPVFQSATTPEVQQQQQQQQTPMVAPVVAPVVPVVAAAPTAPVMTAPADAVPAQATISPQLATVAAPSSAHQQEEDSAPIVQEQENQVDVPENSANERLLSPEAVSNGRDLLTEGVESPGIAQATSTPVVPEVPSAERRTSMSSRRDSMNSLRQFPHNASLTQTGAGSSTLNQQQAVNAGETSDSSISFSRGGERSSVHEKIRGLRQAYPVLLQRIDAYRGDTPRVKKGNPLVDMRPWEADRPLMGRSRAFVDTAPAVATTCTLVGMTGRRSVVALSSRATNDMTLDSHRLNMSLASHAVDNTLDTSMDISRVGYGEDFVDASRKSRANRSRPPSRAKSEVGESGPYPNGIPAARSSAYDYRHPHHYPPQHSGYHSVGRASGRYSSAAMAYPGAQEYYNQYFRRPQSSYDPRAHEKWQRAGGQYGHYDVYAREGDEEEEGSESESVSDEQSDEELREYMHRAPLPQQFTGVQPSMSGYSLRGGLPPAPHAPPSQRLGHDEIYYIGILRLETSTVHRIMQSMPLPREYALLKPMERAAYLYYASVYNQLFSNVLEFQKRFNREFYKYVCEQDDEKTALCKICKTMYDAYQQKRLHSSQKAYEASQKQLFSDERESGDGPITSKRIAALVQTLRQGLSDRASVEDRRDLDDMSDILSVDTSHRAPHKFRTPHAFVTFGPGGRMVTVNPTISVSAVNIDDVKKVLTDPHNRRMIDSAQMFRGPLIEGKTPIHSVRLYIQRQIERIRTSEVALENPRDNDVLDCLLVWQLLEMVVQQQGSSSLLNKVLLQRVTGPDVARLLIAAGASSARPAHPNHKEKSMHGIDSQGPSSRTTSECDPRAFERFTQFLLGGHVDEAIECALRDGLYADAMVLARRTGWDERRLAEIEARFLSTRPVQNPVTTLVTVASGQPAPILTNPPVDDTGSWRTHAAIVLANLSTQHAMETVYHLGRVLAKREYNAAADFCLLAVALLSNANPFQAPSDTDEDVSVRQHIVLIHASLPDDEVESTQCRFGFSLADLHATEIFDFAIRLAQRPSHLACSAAFQKKRLQYARLLADYGGFNTDAYRYCMSVAQMIWNYTNQFSADELHELADLADRLRFLASEEAADTVWIDSLRQMISMLPSVSGTQQQTQPTEATTSNGYDAQLHPQQQEQHQYHQEQQEQQQQQHVQSQEQQQGYNQEPHQQQYIDNSYQSQQQGADPSTTTYQQPIPSVPEVNPISGERSRSGSLAADARDWHAERQEPITIAPHHQQQPMVSSSTPSPKQQPSPPASFQVYSPPMSEYQTPSMPSPTRSRANSTASSSQRTHTEQQPSEQRSTFEDQETSTYDRTGSSTAESSPQRLTRPRADSISWTQQPVAQPNRAQQVPSMPPAPAEPLHQISANQQQQQQQQQQHQQQQQQHQQQQQQQQQQSALPQSAQGKQQGSNQNMNANNNGGGLFGSLKKKFVAALPSSNQMILPDDNNPQIRWNAETQKWEGSGVEAEEAAAAPPPAAASMAPLATNGGGLRAARGSGGSRYFNPMNAASQATAAPGPPPPSMPVMAPPTNFGFIPTSPDDADSVDPFSGQANPTVHGVDQTVEQ